MIRKLGVFREIELRSSKTQLYSFDRRFAYATSRQ
jgi:hypothetical protein